MCGLGCGITSGVLCTEWHCWGAVVLVHFPPQVVLGLQGCGFISRRLRGGNDAYLNKLRGGKGGALSLSRSLGALGALGALGGSVTW